ncbi:Dipeptidyl aminopeptidase BIII [Thalassocella blandensis]|nr:Dipeptidyl aminopeptidase BIII [Thalassocella blandensis]
MKNITLGKLIPAVLCLCLVLVSSSVFADVPGKPSIETFGVLPAISRMRISPSGNLIAFVKTDGDDDSLLVYSLKEKKLIDGAKLGDLSVYDLYFISEKRIIINAGRVRRVMGFKGEFQLGTAYLMDVKSGEINQLLVPGKGVFIGQSGLGDIVGLSPDRKHAYMPAFTGDDFYRDTNPEYSLLRVSLTKRRLPKPILKGANHSYKYYMNSKGKPLAELRYSERTNRHEVFSYLSGEKKEIYSVEESLRTFSAVGITPGEDALIISTTSHELDREVLRTMSLEDGAISSPIFAREDADVERIYTDINQRMIGVRYSGLYPSYEFFDENLNQKMDKIIAFASGDSVWLADWTEDKKSLIVKLEGTSSAGDYYLFNDTNTQTFLASTRSAIPANTINPIGTVTFSARDGLQIPTILTIPNEKVSDMKNLPAVLYPHGGPESHDTVGYDWLPQALASQGYLVIQPQFRGSSGFGVKHTLAGRGEWGKKMQDDLTDSVEFLVKKGIIDPERVCIVGWSYGGYAALAGATFTPDLYKCSVSINGVSDLYRMLKDEKSQHGRDSEVLSYWYTQWSGEDDYDKDLLRSISPAEHVDKVKAPILLIHGDKDKVVSVKQSRLMYKRLQKAEKKVEFVELEGDNHHLSQQDTRLAALSALIDFVNQYLQVPAKP